MKEYLAQLVGTAPDPLMARHLAREYLQARILAGLQRAGAMIPLAFHGGTALRFLYQIPRYSEDLDFALEQARERYNWRAYLKAVEADLTSENYQLVLKISERRAVHSAFIRFPGLLYELRLSPHVDATLSVKVEIDTRPPAGAGLTTTLVRRHVLLHFQHHDRPSLLAGKLHAILQRRWAKGRDLYDLFWYLSNPDWPSPNLGLLNNALQQTGWTGEPLTEASWGDVVWQRLEQMNWEAAVAEVRPFLIDPASLPLLTPENLRRLLLT